MLLMVRRPSPAERSRMVSMSWWNNSGGMALSSVTWSSGPFAGARPRLVAGCGGVAPVGLGAAGQLPLLGPGRADRPQDKLATLAVRPGRHPGEDLDPSRVDQHHAAQVQHDVMVALADQVTQVLPQWGGRIRVDVPAHGADRWAVRWCGRGLQQWGHGGLLARGATWPARKGQRQPPRDPLRIGPAGGLLGGGG